MDYGKQGMDFAKGMGLISGEEYELMDLKFWGGDTTATWEERQKIHAEALAFCNKGKTAFANQIQEVTTTFG
jgi:hypothetical protein